METAKLSTYNKLDNTSASIAFTSDCEVMEVKIDDIISNYKSFGVPEMHATLAGMRQTGMSATALSGYIKQKYPDFILSPDAILSLVDNFIIPDIIRTMEGKKVFDE